MPVERLAFFGVALAYLVLPGHSFALLAGLPLDPFGLAVGLGLLAWTIGLPGTPPRGRLALALFVGMAVMKLGLGWLAPPYGLLGEYRAGGADAPIERSTEWRGPATRIDRALALRGTELPVHFFNDVHRFNYFTDNQPRRDLLPFSARWSGQLWVPSAGRYRVALEANGRASLSLVGLTAGETPLAVTSSQRVKDVSAEAALPAGLHPIEIRYARPDEGLPWIAVLAGRDGGALQPLTAPWLVQPDADLAALAGDGLVRAAAVALDVAFLMLLTALLCLHVLAAPRPVTPLSRLERPLLGLFAVIALGLEMVGHLHLARQTLILSGGNDWLAYEGFARDVLLDGPLLSEGRPLGQGHPYYYQPLYIYWLALVHLVLGEGLFGPLFANAALGVAASLLVYVLTRELFGRLSAAVALVVFALCRVTFFAPTTGLLLSENLLIPIVPLVLLLLARAARTGAWSAVLGAGVVLGLAGLTRTTPLALLPPALLILALAFRRLGVGRRSATLRLAAFAAVCMLTISPATARNYLVSGRLVPITSSAGANLWEAHRPSERVDLSGIDRDLLYERLALDRKTREVLEFIRQDPLGYARSLLPTGLYAIGVVGPVAGTAEIHPGLLGVWLAYLLTTVLVPSARRLPTWFLHAFVWSHLAQMTLFMSHQYGFRLILPMYVAMAPIVGLGLAAAVRLLARQAWLPLRRPTPHPPSHTTGRGRPIVTNVLPRTRLGTFGIFGHLWASLADRLGPVGPLSPHIRKPTSPPSATSLLFCAIGAAGLLGSFGLLARAPSPERARDGFYGLSGDAAIALRQAARPDLLRQADAAYFVGDDSRSSAVAYLRGLAYPTARWFDGARGLVLPPPGQQALYILPDRAAADFARRCLGDEAIVAREQDVASRAWLDLALAGPEDSECARSQNVVGAPFEGTARLLGFDAPSTAEPGQAVDVVLRWEVLARPTSRARPLVRLVDSKGVRWGQAEATAYPSSAWQPGEVALGIARLEIDPTLPPTDFSLELGFIAGSALAPLAEDGPWGSRGELTARGGPLRLVSRSTPLHPDALPIGVPTELDFGGVRLLGAQVDRPTARPGDRVRVSLFWQNTVGRLPERDVSLILRDRAGAVLREWRGGPVDGTYPTSVWKPGEIVRDIHDLIVPARAPFEPLDLAVTLGPAGLPPERYEPLTTLTVQPIERRFAEPNPRTRQEARFGDLARLVGFEVRNRRLKAGDAVEATLTWQALAETGEGHAVSLQLRSDDGAIVARQESEPVADRRPTTGWLTGEYLEDEHRLRVPRETPRGRYRLAVVVYRTEDRRRLLDPTGTDHVVLNTEVVVE